ncbi:MAG: amidohydrolase [Prevotella sp.]|jgi:omega-amidase
MKVTILQTDISWANPLENISNIKQLLDGNAGADLYVLPEMFSTGFATQPEGIAETDCLSLNWMKAEARKRNCAIAGSVATQENGKYYNRFYFVYPDGSERHYDKRHLFTYSGEDKHFTAGQERVIVDYRGFRILLQVCYDLRFPVFSRNHNDYDMAIYVASWPTVRLKAWLTLLHARAIENQCYVIGVDRTGDDPSCSYSGGSEIIDPWGNTIAECERNKVDAATADLSMEPLVKFRQQFPVLEDGDRFLIK